MSASLNIHFGMHFDPMSLLMLLIVTGVGSAIHVYSIGYMKGDPDARAFLCRVEPFHFFHAGNCAEQQFLPDVYLLGIGRPLQLFAHWLLV